MQGMYSYMFDFNCNVHTSTRNIYLNNYLYRIDILNRLTHKINWCSLDNKMMHIINIEIYTALLNYQKCVNL